MTNQVNQAFEKWYQSKIDEANENNDMDMRHEFHRNKERYKYGWQAATQASESEINSLKQRIKELEDAKKDLEDEVFFKNELISTKRKDVLDITDSFLQRVKELQADNLRLREALEIIRMLPDLECVLYKCDLALSSTPAQ